MESFGLFDLFKSLFAPADAENPDLSPKENAPSSPPPDEPPPPAPQTPPPADPPQNAFLDFIHAHDERAKRTKKK